MIIIQVLTLIAGIALLVLIIGTVTLAATIGGGLFYGLLVLALLIGNAYVWGHQ